MNVSPDFHVQLYCHPKSTPQEIGEITYQGRKLRQAVQPTKTGFFECSFESLMAQMLKWSGVYAEWDGSWSWTATEKNEAGRPAWRLEGMMYDRDEHVFYIEMQGQCTLSAWRTIVDALQLSAEQQLGICLTKQGCWVEPASFEEWLEKS